MCPPTGHRRTQRGSRSRRDRRTTARASHGGDGFLAPPPSTGAPSVHDASTPPHLHRRLPPPRSKGPFVGALGQPPSLPRAATLQPVASQTRLVAAALPAALRKAAGRGLSQKNWAGGGGGGAERASPKKEHGGRVSGASRGGPTRDTARTMRGGGGLALGSPRRSGGAQQRLQREARRRRLPAPQVASRRWGTTATTRLAVAPHAGPPSS